MDDPTEGALQPLLFEWDEGNKEKNWLNHGVRNSECEEVFLNQPLFIHGDSQHSDRESRQFALGQTHAGRRLFVVFTLRGPNVRVISARDMSRRERRSYEKAEAQIDT